VTECAASVVCALFAAHRNTVNASLLIYRAQVFSLETRVGQEFGFALERPLASVSAEARAVGCVGFITIRRGDEAPA
jgi:hypothetical protein